MASLAELYRELGETGKVFYDYLLQNNHKMEGRLAGFWFTPSDPVDIWGEFNFTLKSWQNISVYLDDLMNDFPQHLEFLGLFSKIINEIISIKEKENA